MPLAYDTLLLDGGGKLPVVVLAQIERTRRGQLERGYRIRKVARPPVMVHPFHTSLRRRLIFTPGGLERAQYLGGYEDEIHINGVVVRIRQRAATEDKYVHFARLTETRKVALGMMAIEGIAANDPQEDLFTLDPLEGGSSANAQTQTHPYKRRGRPILPDGSMLYGPYIAWGSCSPSPTYTIAKPSQAFNGRGV